MRRTLPVAALTAILVAGCDTASTPLAPPDEALLARADQAPIYLVTFHEGVSDVEATARDLARRQGFTLRAVRRHAAPGFSAVIPQGRVDAVRSDPRVALVEKDGPVSLIRPVDGNAKPCWAGGGDCGGGGGSQQTPWGITRIGGPADGTGRTAWVIDTGIDLDHADLNTSRNCHANFVTKGQDSPQDGNGHGTHVAGTIGAKNNDLDVVGVAANAYVCAVRVLDNSGSGTWEGVVNGVNYVAANGKSGEVANMSLGGSGSNATLEKAILDAAAKGIIFAIAAGNDGDDAKNYTPANLGDNSTRIHVVSATATNDCLTSWSNYGADVDYAAPGASILSTKKGGGTTTMSGTSMAAPHVAGIALMGNVGTDGSACGDPDGRADPIAHL